MEAWRNDPPETDFRRANFTTGAVGVVAAPAGIAAG